MVLIYLFFITKAESKMTESYGWWWIWIFMPFFIIIFRESFGNTQRRWHSESVEVIGTHGASCLTAEGDSARN